MQISQSIISAESNQRNKQNLSVQSVQFVPFYGIRVIFGYYTG